MPLWSAKKEEPMWVKQELCLVPHICTVTTVEQTYITVSGTGTGII